MTEMTKTTRERESRISPSIQPLLVAFKDSEYFAQINAAIALSRFQDLAINTYFAGFLKSEWRTLIGLKRGIPEH